MFNRPFLFGLILVSISLYLLFTQADLKFLSAQTTRLSAMDQCFKERQIPCRWVANLDQQYGSPLFNFEAPLSYYLGEIIVLAVKDYQTSVKIIYSIIILGGYLFIFLFAKRFLGKIQSFLLALLYTILLYGVIISMPYEGMGLSLGLMLLPVIPLSIRLLAQKKGILQAILFVVLLTFLILVSNYYMIFTGISFILIIFYYINLKGEGKFLSLSLFSIFISFSLSAFYVLPAVLERNLVRPISEVNRTYYLPSSAKEIPQESAGLGYKILTGESDILDFEQGTNWFKFKTKTHSHTIIRISQFYFPDWKIFIDSKEAKVEYLNNSFGLMTIILGEGDHIIEGRLHDSPIRAISNIISLTSFALLIMLFLTQSKKVQLWLNYYKKRIG